MTEHWDVIVVGGGLAGLAAGATAAAGGASTLVLEAGAAGGRARTHTERGFVFNQGAHALYVGGHGWKVLVPDRHGVIYVDGGFSSMVTARERTVQVRTGTRVVGLVPGEDSVEVETDQGPLTGRRVVLAPGTPAATRALLPGDPEWG